MHERTQGDFSDVTEVPGLPVTRVQLARGYHRYEVARESARGGDLLEVACGAGQGLAFLAHDARRVVGGDRSARNLAIARRVHVGRVPLVRFDAQALPFRSASFDAVVMLEAIYYLPDADRAVAECVRVLRPSGRLVLSSVNPAWPDFGPSVHSTRYLASDELAQLLARHGLDGRLFGAFPEASGPATLARSLLRRAAVRFGLLPGSLRAKAMLKRFFYGPLVRQPELLDPVGGTTRGLDLAPIPAGTRDTRHSILYAIGVRA